MPPKTSSSDTVQRALRATFTEIVTLAPAAGLPGSVDAVHDLRVAVRRLRVLLKVFGPALPRRPARTFRTEFKWISRLLGQVRDRDVMLQQLDRFPAGQSLRHKQERSAFGRHLQRGQRRAAVRLRQALHGPRFRVLTGRFHHFLDVTLPAATRSAAATPQPPWPVALKRLLEGEIAAVRRRNRRVHRHAPCDEALHAFRIRCKRLRFVLELASPRAGQPVGRLRRETLRLLKVLGAYQDTVVLRQAHERFHRSQPGGGDADSPLRQPLEQRRVAARRRALGRRPRFDRACRRYCVCCAKSRE